MSVQANIIDTSAKRNYLERAKAGIVITPNLADLSIDLRANRVNFYKPAPKKVKDAKCSKSKKAMMDCGNYLDAPAGRA